MNAQDTSSLYVAHAPRSPIAATLSIAARIGESGAPLRIRGESGTGKETLARIVHGAGRDSGSRFLVVQCAGRTPHELAFELFDAPQEGIGTVFLEDVDEMPASIQARLVHSLDAYADPAPAPAPRRRIIASSTVDLDVAVSQARFRRDLFDALACSIHIPPLRERRDDVLHVWERCWGTLSNGRTLSGGARELIKQYAWPGNARQLRAFAAQLVASCPWQNLSTRDVELQLFSTATGIPSHVFPVCIADPAPTSEVLSVAMPVEELRRVGVEVPPAPVEDGAVDLPELLRRIETTLIEWALAQAHGNKAVAAQKLGLRRTTLVEKIRRLHGAKPVEPTTAWSASTKPSA
jgi:two-component system nitrogen regulation response regulator GlnG